MKIGFLGDIFAGYVNKENDNIHKMIESYAQSSILPILNSLDCVIGNLEAPITKSSTPIFKTGPAIKNNEKVIDLLKISNISYVTLANNHINDFGLDGIADTIEICNNNSIETFGAGQSKNEIVKPLFIKNDYLSIGIISVAENEFNSISNDFGSNKLEIIDIFEQINLAKAKSDYVIVIYHGGHEQFSYPSPRIKKLNHFFVDIGADAVVCHHPHVVQGFETYKEKPIFYSLGNYFFPSIEKEKSNHEGYIVVFNFSRNNFDFEIIPYNQCIDEYKVDIINDEQKIEFFKKIDNLSKIIINDEELVNNWNEFAKTRHDFFLLSLLPFNKRVSSKLLKSGLLKKVVPSKHFLKILNLIRCESHRDILINTLKKYSSFLF